ncbi:SsrA-binding protein SmpB [Desertimonas flava]|jgi:SsrA-binding protein|uniref:SsrA-binding protein SmpB n=1 Tax=Desertimonas flava TaxID=2064846 RepID=UPI000E3429B7|nr:SsrA-binding protein SmpB [Desertimonas flava]
MAKSSTKAKGATKADAANRVIASNRRARHTYAILDTVEAGMVLSGSEVKSLRHGLVQLADAYARISDGEAWLEGVHIAPYAFAQGFGSHVPERRRKLLLHRSEIDRLQARVVGEQLTLVPLSLYFKDGRAKVELALAKGRQKADKRQAIAERDSKREIERALGRQRKYGA